MNDRFELDQEDQKMIANLDIDKLNSPDPNIDKEEDRDKLIQ